MQSNVLAASPSSHSQVFKVVLASCIGTAMEWYDFFVYGFVASLVFDRLFFPAFDPFVRTLVVLATFSIGFMARPIGAIIFGHFGDRVGRKTVLLITMLMMGISTALIGLLPTYGQIGLWASVALIMLRLTQGIALGGESIGALLMTIEAAPANRRGLLGSLVMATGAFAQVVGSLVVLSVAKLDDAQFLAWGWRVPFLISVLLIGVGLYVRLRVEESPVFKNAQRKEALVKVPLFEAFKHHKRSLAVVIFAAFSQSCFFYLITIFALSYGTKMLHIPRETFTIALLLGNALEMFTAPLCGALSDRFGRRRIFMLGVLASGLYVFPFFTLLRSGNDILIILSVVIGVGLVHALMFGPEGSLFPSLFPTHVRFSGVSIAKQIGVVGGGLMPVIATSLSSGLNGSLTGVVIFSMCLAGTAFVGLSLAQVRNLE